MTDSNFNIFARVPTRFRCSKCGGVAVAYVPAPTTTVEHADAVGIAIAFLQTIVNDCHTVSAVATHCALDLIAGELAATRSAMAANDKTLARLQLELMKNLEATRREIAKINQKKTRKLPRSKFHKKRAPVAGGK